jgi:hypothetical protein
MSTEKRHAVFQPHEWSDRIGVLLPDEHGSWSMRDVIGPRDACLAIHIRETVREHVSFGPAVPADVFLLAVGEAPTRDCTKIGGLPYWPCNRVWPQSRAGEPLPFLAQFCLHDSLDIVGSVPEDMLLLFGDKNNPSTIVAKWQSLSCGSKLLTRKEMPVKPVTPCFYGTRWRTENYPNATYSDPVRLPDGNTVSELWFVCQLLGMQIGTHPYFPKWDTPPIITERVVCSLSAVFPIPNLDWPFMNRALPLTAEEVDDFTFDLLEFTNADGFSVLSVAVAASGEPRVSFQNL